MIKKSLVIFILFLVMFAFFVNAITTEEEYETGEGSDAAIDNFLTKEKIDSSSSIKTSISNLLNPLKNRLLNFGGSIKEITT